MEIPGGYTEQEFVDILTNLGNIYAKRFSFGYYDEDDIRQEIYLLGIQALKHYDPNKSELKVFLGIFVRSRLCNIIRDHYFRYEVPNCPCEICEKYKNITSDEILEKRRKCKRFNNWYVKNNLKRNLVDAVSFSEDSYNNADELDICKISNNELIEYVQERLSPQLRPLYCRFMEGVSLTPSERERLLTEVRNIIESQSYEQI